MVPPTMAPTGVFPFILSCSEVDKTDDGVVLGPELETGMVPITVKEPSGGVVPREEVVVSLIVVVSIVVMLPWVPLTTQELVVVNEGAMGELVFEHHDFVLV